MRNRSTTQAADDICLYGVGILEFVNHQQANSCRNPLTHVFVVAQQIAGIEQQVVKVEHSLCLLSGRVLGRSSLCQSDSSASKFRSTKHIRLVILEVLDRFFGFGSQFFEGQLDCVLEFVSRPAFCDTLSRDAGRLDDFGQDRLVILPGERGGQQA